MAKKASIRRVHPASIANLFVRGILADIGQELGGFSHEQWSATLNYFQNCCAYTGKAVPTPNLDRDHAVPVNRLHAGLHMYGNLVPSTRQANNEKGPMTFTEFLRSNKPSLTHLSEDEREQRIAHIEAFQQQTNYQQRRDSLPDLAAYCEQQYSRVKELYEEINLKTLDWLKEQGIELVADSAEVDVDMDLSVYAEEDLTSYLPEPFASLISEYGDAPNREFIQRLFDQLNDSGMLSQYVDKLLTREYSAKLKSAVPVLATERVKIPNIFRHYPKVLRINGKKYFLSSQWNKPQRGVLFAWLTDEVFAKEVKAATSLS